MIFITVPDEFLLQFISVFIIFLSYPFNGEILI